MKGQNDVKLIFTRVYGDINGLRQQKNKANFKRNVIFSAEGLRLPQSLRSFAMTFVGNLKKQSQFLKGQINTNFCLTKDYGNKTAFGLRKNKANSKPISDETTVFSAYYTRDCPIGIWSRIPCHLECSVVFL
jgi:hypothetical protein